MNTQALKPKIVEANGTASPQPTEKLTWVERAAADYAIAKSAQPEDPVDNLVAQGQVQQPAVTSHPEVKVGDKTHDLVESNFDGMGGAV